MMADVEESVHNISDPRVLVMCTDINFSEDFNYSNESESTSGLYQIWRAHDHKFPRLT